jgi:hypothetical protein
MDRIANNSLGWMSKEERVQLRAHPGLEWVFHAPRGLTNLRRAFPTAPEETTMLDLVYQRARGHMAIPVINQASPGRRRWRQASVLALRCCRDCRSDFSARRWSAASSRVRPRGGAYTHRRPSIPTRDHHVTSGIRGTAPSWAARTRRAGVDIQRVDPQSPMPGKASLRSSCKVPQNCATAWSNAICDRWLVRTEGLQPALVLPAEVSGDVLRR